MNILLVHNYYQLPGGEDSVVENEKRMLEAHGHKVCLYTRHNSELNKIGFLGKLLLPVNTIFSYRTYKDVKKLIKANKIDVVHVHNTLNLISPSVYYAAMSCKVKVVQTVHNFRLLCPGATFYRDGHICEECLKKGLCQSVRYSCYRNSKIQTLASAMLLYVHRLIGTYKKINYICLTEFNKKKLLELRQIKEERVFIKPNFSHVQNVTIPKRRKNQYVFVGRLEKIKGVDILLRAFANLSDNKHKLIILGSGELDGLAKKYIEKHGLKNVEIRGHVEHEEVLKTMAESKALILPSQWYEGFPVVIAEAFSLGLPVITGDMGNAGSLVKDGYTGKKYKYDNSKDLAKAISEFEKLDRKQLGINCTEEYDSLYSEEKNYQLLMDIYNKLI